LLRACNRPPQSAFVATEQLLDEWARTQDPRVRENAIAPEPHRLDLCPTAKTTDQPTANQFRSSPLGNAILDESPISRQSVMFSLTKPGKNVLPVLPRIPHFPRNY